MTSSESMDMAAILDQRARVPQHVVHRAFVSETVILNLQTGKYHGMNPTGGRMLEELNRADSVRAAAAELAAEYGRPADEIERDLCQFCVELAERGLIELTPP